MKRTLFLIITSIVLLTACGNNNDNKNNQSVNKQETKTDSNSVKTIATDKTYKVIITARFCHLKKVRPVVYYKITWQIVTMVTISKVVY